MTSKKNASESDKIILNPISFDVRDVEFAIGHLATYGI